MLEWKQGNQPYKNKGYSPDMPFGCLAKVWMSPHDLHTYHTPRVHLMSDNKRPKSHHAAFTQCNPTRTIPTGCTKLAVGAI